MNDILGGGGFTSRLLTRIRSDEGLAYSAYSNFGVGIYSNGVFRVSFQSRSETVARASSIVFEEIDRIRDQQVTEAELRTSKASKRLRVIFPVLHQRPIFLRVTNILVVILNIC